MQSSVIGKIEKAKKYTQEKDRVTFTSLAVDFKGENDDHRVAFNSETWACSCSFFAGHGFCSHSMALQQMLEGMLPPVAAFTP